MYEVVPATEAHALELAPRMRQADADEAWALCHYTPQEALMVSLEHSRSWAWLVDGRVLCMLGDQEVSPGEDCAILWLSGAKELPKHTHAFIRMNIAYLAWVRHQYGLLYNFVDARHTVAVRWLQWLNFTVEPAKAFGAEGLPFHLARIEGSQ